MARAPVSSLPCHGHQPPLPPRAPLHQPLPPLVILHRQQLPAPRCNSTWWNIPQPCVQGPPASQQLLGYLQGGGGSLVPVVNWLLGWWGHGAPHPASAHQQISRHRPAANRTPSPTPITPLHPVAGWDWSPTPKGISPVASRRVGRGAGVADGGNAGVKNKI